MPTRGEAARLRGGNPDEPLAELTIRSWQYGENTEFVINPPFDALASTRNGILTQDGAFRPRPALVDYGDGVLPGKCVSKPLPFTHKGEFHLIAAFLDSGRTIIAIQQGEQVDWIQVNQGAWSNPDGNRIHFSQVRNQIIVTGGQKSMGLGNSVGFIDLDEANRKIFIPPKIDDIGGNINLVVPDRLKSTSLSDPLYTYGVTAKNEFGETVISALKSVRLNKFRSDFNQNDGDQVALNWIAPASGSDARQVNPDLVFDVYIGINNEAPLKLLKADVSGTQYDDMGQDNPQAVIPPVGNGTELPDVKYSTNVAGRVFLYGDRDVPARITYGGRRKNALKFFRGDESDSLEVSLRNDEEVLTVEGFLNNRGENGVLVYTGQGSAGFGKEYFLRPAQIVAGDVIIDTFTVSETGQIGTNSPYGVVNYLNNLYRPTKDGFKAHGIRPRLQNVIATDSIDQTIRNRSLALNSRNMDKAVGAFYQQKIYWAIPDNSDTPNKIWSLDLTQEQGAWMLGWEVPADWILNINNDSGQETLLVIKDNTIKRFRYITGVEAFDWGADSTRSHSPVSKVTDIAAIFGVFVLYRLKGSVELIVKGWTRNGFDQDIGNAVASADAEAEQFGGWNAFNWNSVPWGEPKILTSTTGDGQELVYVIINLNSAICRTISYSIRNASDYADVQLGDFILIYTSGGLTQIAQNG